MVEIGLEVEAGVDPFSKLGEGVYISVCSGRWHHQVQQVFIAPVHLRTGL